MPLPARSRTKLSESYCYNREPQRSNAQTFYLDFATARITVQAIDTLRHKEMILGIGMLLKTVLSGPPCTARVFPQRQFGDERS